MFPVIETLDDVRPYIGGNIGFFVTRFDNYDVVDYGFVSEETFRTPMALECRGLKFSKDGRLIARPFHKFFNLGEREQPHEIDWSRPHAVLDKLDGSMVHPCMIADEMVFMTRMGVTAHATAALGFASQNVIDLAHHLLRAGNTGIFEFTSPQNRVVIAYEKPELTLLAVRENRSGRYLTSSELAELADRFAVPLIGSVEIAGTMRDFVSIARDEADKEGYVIAFEDGHRLKLKTAYYALRHKALSDISLEKNVLDWVANDAVDDVLPLLPPQAAARLKAYHNRVMTALGRNFETVGAFVEEYSTLDRKDFAQLVRDKLDARLHPIAFQMLDGRDGRQAMKKILKGVAVTSTRLDSVRDLYDMSWDASDLVSEPN